VSGRLAAYAPRVNLLVVDDPPVVGAALLGLDALGASPDAGAAVRTALLTRAPRPHASASAAS
jgi:hypothetical protein